MKVYIVMMHVIHEGSYIDGVYSTKRRANKEAELANKDAQTGVIYEVHEQEIKS